jgi:hypothetical protein
MKTDAELRKDIRELAENAYSGQLIPATLDADSFEAASAQLDKMLRKRESYQPFLVVTEDTDPDRILTVAVTGNGPTSEANARLFSAARWLILMLLDDIDELIEANIKLDDDLIALREGR